MFFKRKVELTDEENKMNKLWELYSSGELDDINHKIYCLCEYESEVNGEGHSGFFYNSDNCGELADLIDTLKEILPERHCQNLIDAYNSYETENEDEICENADDFFYSEESEILDILQKFANTLE